MNQKKCPKCGENNPPEAVMCWACYTPLSGGAVAPAMAGGAVGPRGPGGPPGAGTLAAPGDAPSGGISVQPWMYAVGGVVLLVILVIGAKALFGGGDTSGDVPPVSAGSSSTTSSYPSTGSSRTSSPSVAGPAVAAPASTGSPAGNAVPMKFSIGAVPNPNESIGVVGIASTEPISPGQAGGVAKYARTVFANANHYDQLQIYVFRDQQANARFKEFQAGHRNAPLSEADFVNLNDLWPDTLAVYVFSKGGEKVYVPSNGNWYGNLVG
ncbi:MAG: zinc ribbon domain-containing protein [Abitibacteriaceae bacterium]|nr:zinc ribbon domain-containing protein [Abditibacteriaceae bacterium]